MNLKTVLNDVYGSAKSEKPEKVKKVSHGGSGRGGSKAMTLPSVKSVMFSCAQ